MCRGNVSELELEPEQPLDCADISERLTSNPGRETVRLTSNPGRESEIN